MNSFGRKLKISIFGESHGESVGIIIDGLPSGLKLDMDKIKEDLKRRQGGKGLTTARKEDDVPKIISGYFNERTTGTPLCAVFENNNTKTEDYEKMAELLRPSHADYTGLIKYNGFNDYRGGGHFSGRLTVLLVFVGAICKQLLSKNGIEIYAQILKIGDIKDKDFNKIDFNYNCINKFDLMLDEEKKQQALTLVEEVKRKGDSIGAVVQCGAIGLKAGIGDPFFDSLESRISQLAFSIPGVKGIEFGKGFGFANGLGSELNDEIILFDGGIQTKDNYNGGILGGISNGMPVIYNLAIKPTPSILLEQNTVNIKTMKEDVIKIEGRHDACIALRALPVVEAITALAIYDLWS